MWLCWINVKMQHWCNVDSTLSTLMQHCFINVDSTCKFNVESTLDQRWSVETTLIQFANSTKIQRWFNVGVPAGWVWSHRLHGSAETGPALPIAICRENGDAIHKSTGISRPAWSVYWVCGLAVTAGILVKFVTAHGRSRPEVGSTKRIDVYGSGGVSRPSCILGKPEQNIIAPTHFLRPKQNFNSLTICTLDQYLPNGSEKSGLLS